MAAATTVPPPLTAATVVVLPPLTVVCVKWGTKYGPDYVLKLRAGVGRYLSRPHQFVCLTDDVDGLHKARDEEGVRIC